MQQELEIIRQENIEMDRHDSAFHQMQLTCAYLADGVRKLKGYSAIATEEPDPTSEDTTEREIIL